MTPHYYYSVTHHHAHENQSSDFARSADDLEQARRLLLLWVSHHISQTLRADEVENGDADQKDSTYEPA